jgi:hypothetical protein
MKHRHRWRVVACCWPYPPGYGTQCSRCRMVLDTGLPRWQAEAIVREMNGEDRRYHVWRRIIDSIVTATWRW